ncbi:hypothetical protein DICVIV_14403 [Dictyocaulus viviparus]|uniref:Uncharacterized protein n=1 Tax=Dictyocaulus viviparus TaxID=29172 RepID=A0A0D8X7G2_DICVI|nr:hypothetical protein DICVIV_14403 [Dictyocaulus viviparus]
MINRVRLATMSTRVVAVTLKALGVDLAGASVSLVRSRYRKGIGLIFPNVDTEIMIRMNHLRGNASELGERRSKTELENGLPGIGSAVGTDVISVKYRGFCDISCFLDDP